MLYEALLMNRNRTIWIVAAMLIATAGVCSADEVFPVVHREPITVRVLDGKSGKPQPRVHVLLTAGYDRHDLALGMWRQEAVTDAEGKVHLSDGLRNLPLLRVEVLKRHECSAGAGNAPTSVELIRRDGLSGANRCGFASFENAPGVLTLFVKGKNAKTDHAPANTAEPVALQAKSETPAKEQALEPSPQPPLTDVEVAQMLAEQN
jgi:hypothetical protein